jgi:hypothetical protein
MGAFSTDFIGANWDYPEASYADRARIWKAHEDYQKGLLYFVATDPRIPKEVQSEIRKWGLPKDEFQENGGWPYQLYVREARRMVGEYVMTEHNCRGEVEVTDVIGMAAYTMDSHNCDRHFLNGMVKNEGNVEVGGFPPYPVSFRSIVPKREECTNLTVPVCMSASHIAYGSIRMEPVFMVLAQSAAVAASMAIDKGIPVQMVDVPSLQAKLKNDPLLDGNAAEILVDDHFHSGNIEYKGSWKLGEGNISKYGKTIRLGENQTGNSVRFKASLPKAGSFNAYYYFPRFWENQDNVDSVRFTVFDGKKTHTRSVFTNQDSFHSEDNKGLWIHLGRFSVKSGAETWIEMNGLGNKPAKLPADAILWVPEKKK